MKTMMLMILFALILFIIVLTLAIIGLTKESNKSHADYTWNDIFGFLKFKRIKFKLPKLFLSKIEKNVELVVFYCKEYEKLPKDYKDDFENLINNNDLAELDLSELARIKADYTKDILESIQYQEYMKVAIANNQRSKENILVRKRLEGLL